MGNKNVKLHPEEVTRLQSRRHAVELFEKNGFRLLRYYFGIKDIFTYSVIVVEKPLAPGAPASGPTLRAEAASPPNAVPMTSGHATRG